MFPSCNIANENLKYDIRPLLVVFWFLVIHLITFLPSKVKGQRYYLTGPEGMQKTTANNRTHTDSKIHVYTDM